MQNQQRVIYIYHIYPAYFFQRIQSFIIQLQKMQKTTGVEQINENRKNQFIQKENTTGFDIFDVIMGQGHEWHSQPHQENILISDSRLNQIEQDEVQEENISHSSSNAPARGGQNRNIYKFMIKLLKKALLIFKDHFNSSSKISEMHQQMLSQLNKLHTWEKENPEKNYLGIKYLKDWLCCQDTEEIKLRSRIARLIAQKGICRLIKSDVLLNNRITQKRIYLNALKVYRLRLNNSQTASRFTSK